MTNNITQHFTFKQWLIDSASKTCLSLLSCAAAWPHWSPEVLVLRRQVLTNRNLLQFPLSKLKMIKLIQ